MTDDFCAVVSPKGQKCLRLPNHKGLHQSWNCSFNPDGFEEDWGICKKTRKKVHFVEEAKME